MNESLPKTLMPYKHLINSFEKETDSIFEDGKGYWIYLKDEYIDLESDCQSIHEHTLKECIFRLKNYVIYVIKEVKWKHLKET